MSRRETSWFNQLKDDEKETRDGKTFVYLKGLRRLAELAGRKRDAVKFGHAFYIPTETGHILFAQVAYEIEFEDGTVWAGTADAHANNCPELGHYPSAVAESRAEARALRKALGIAELAKEEISDVPIENMLGRRITNEQKIMLEKIAKEREMSHIDIIKNASSRKGITSLEDLTYEEGQKAAIFVNKYGRKGK